MYATFGVPDVATGATVHAYASLPVSVQVDGLLWMTNCVLQGAGNNSRAVDVTTKDEGLPQMYVQGAATCIPSPGSPMPYQC